MWTRLPSITSILVGTSHCSNSGLWNYLLICIPSPGCKVTPASYPWKTTHGIPSISRIPPLPVGHGSSLPCDDPSATTRNTWNISADLDMKSSLSTQFGHSTNNFICEKKNCLHQVDYKPHVNRTLKLSVNSMNSCLNKWTLYPSEHQGLQHYKENFPFSTLWPIVGSRLFFQGWCSVRGKTSFELCQT